MSRVAIIAIAVASRVASADPSLDRVLAAPTAWLPAAGGLDQRGDTAIAFAYGLGELASVDVGEDSDVRACGTPPCAGARRGVPIHQGRAAFRIGAHQDAWFAGQPALVLGVAESFASSTRVGQAYVVATRTFGPIAAHAGAE